MNKRAWIKALLLSSPHSHRLAPALALVMAAQHFFEVVETYRVKFRRIPGRGLAMKIRFRNLSEAEYLDDAICSVFDTVK